MKRSKIYREIEIGNEMTASIDKNGLTRIVRTSKALRAKDKENWVLLNVEQLANLSIAAFEMSKKELPQ